MRDLEFYTRLVLNRLRVETQLREGGPKQEIADQHECDTDRRDSENGDGETADRELAVRR